jgi:hypothetical protein
MGFQDSSFRKEIVIDSSKVDGPLTDFPVVVHLDADSDLAANAQPSGDDIAFVASDETTQLSHEIEEYDGSTGTLWAHVKVPSLSATTDTEIYIYYGNPSASNQENITGVWDSNFQGVYHLSEERSGTGNSGVYKDSTGTNDGIDNVSAGGQTGQIYEGQEFDGSDDSIDLGADPIGDGDLTISAWISTQTGGAVSDNFTGSVPQVKLRIHDGQFGRSPLGGARLRFLDIKGNETAADSATRVDDGNLHFVAGVRDGDTARVYIDGIEDATDTNTNTGTDLTNSNRRIGSRADGAEPFDGFIDEFRVSNTNRSDAFLETTYLNQDDPLSFYSVGAQESLILTKEAVASAAGTTTANAARSRSVVTPTKSTSTVEPVSPELREQRSQSIDADTAVELGTTRPVPSLSVVTPLTTAATTTTATTRELLTTAANAQTTAVETQTRFFKFARTQATSSTQAETGPQILSIDAPTDTVVSPLTLFNLRELTQNRRSIDGADNTDAVFDRPTDTVEYEEPPDGVEYDT